MWCTTCESTIDDEAAFCPFCGMVVPDAPTYDDYVYEAFISYRHLERDRKVAMRLQRRLEGMRIPKGVQAADGRKRLGKLFRDEDELPTDASLPDQIRDALKRSPYLVVVCSPQTRESIWVQREVELFASLHGRDRIRIALAAGEPDESFPALLRSRLVPDGEGGVVSVEEEPIAANFRDDSRKTFRLESLRIAATLIGCGFDDLRQRMHARRMRLIATATSAVAVASTAFGSFSLWQQHQIEENYRQAQINESEALAVESQALLAAGDRMEAIQVALAALPQSSVAADRPYVPAAQIALERSLQAYPPEEFWRSCYAVGDVQEPYAVSEDGLQAFARLDGTISVATLDEGAQVASIDLETALSTTDEPDFEVEPSMLAFCDEKLFCASAHNHALACFDAQTGGALWTKTDVASKGAWGGRNLCISPDGSTIALGTTNMLDFDAKEKGVTVRLFDAADGTVRARFHMSVEQVPDAATGTTDVRLAFSPDGSALAVASLGVIWRIDLATGETQRATTTLPGAYDLTYLDDAIVSITGKGSGVSVLLGTACFDAYDADLTPLWTKSETPATYYDNEGIFHSSFAFVVGGHAEEGEAPEVAYVTSNEVKYVDLATGEQRYVLREHSPVRAAVLTSGGLLSTLDYEGTLQTRSIDSAEGTLLALSQLSVDEGEYATLTLVDDQPYAMVWDDEARSYRIYRFGRRQGGIPNLETVESLEGLEIDSMYHPRAEEGEERAGYYLLLKSDDGFAIVGQDSFDPLWTKTYEELGLGSHVTIGFADGNVLAYTTQTEGDEGALVVESYACETGAQVDKLRLSANELGWIGVTDAGLCRLQGEPVLYVVGTTTSELVSEVRFFARDDGRELLRIGPLEHKIQKLFFARGTAITVYDESGRGHFALFSLEDGRVREGTDAETLLLANAYHASQDVAMSSDETRIVVLGANGTMTCLDTGTWSVLWERPFASAQAVSFSLDGSRLLVQDHTGTLYLLSAETGETLRSSSVQLPTIKGFQYDEEHPELLYVICLSMGLQRPETSYAVLSLDEDAFGPQSCVYSGVYYTPTQGKVLVHDPLLGEWGSVPLYTLDELIELAHTTIEGHELDDTARHRYRIPALDLV